MPGRRQESGRTSGKSVTPIVGVVAALAVAVAGGVALFAHIDALRQGPETAPPRGGATVADGLAPTAGFAGILGARSDRVRAVRLAGNERVLVLDFPNLRSQGRSLNRMAVLIEKLGAPRDRVLSDAELADYIRAAGSSPEIFYFGHDYRAADIVRFFSLAQAGAVALNPEEVELREVLVRNRFLRRTEGGYAMVLPERVLVSVAQVQPDDPATEPDETVDQGLRETTLRHELSHGEFFTNPAYRDYCYRFWREVMTDAQRRSFVEFLTSAGYDPSSETVMVNEMQAFLMHTPDPRAFSAEHLGVTPRDLAALRQSFEAGAPASTLSGARAATAEPLTGGN